MPIELVAAPLHRPWRLIALPALFAGLVSFGWYEFDLSLASIFGRGIAIAALYPTIRLFVHSKTMSSDQNFDIPQHRFVNANQGSAFSLLLSAMWSGRSSPRGDGESVVVLALLLAFFLLTLVIWVLYYSRIRRGRSPSVESAID